MEEKIVTYTLEYAIAIGISVIYILAYLLRTALKYYRSTVFNVHIQELSTYEWRSKYLNRLVEKINVTTSLVEKKIAAEDIVAQCIYNHDAVQQLGVELNELFQSQYDTIREQYPSLTPLDLLVLTLLAIDLKNSEICSVLRMEKRTLYRRRQLIAQRMGISSAELEQYAAQMIISL